MKKSLSVAMVVAMVSSMFASMAFADDAATTTTTSTPSTAQEKYDALVKAGVFDADGTGTGADLNGLTTRAQIAKIIAKVYNLSDDAASASVFTDLDGSGWATGYIGAVAKQKLMEGRADGVFAPTANVKLEELAIILARAFKLDTAASTDVGAGKVDDWAKGAVAATVKAGLIPASTDFTQEAIRSDLATSAFAAVAKVAADKAAADAAAAAKNIKVASVASVSNTRTLVTFDKDASAAGIQASDFTVKDSAGTAVTVSAAKLRGDKVGVFVDTAALTAGSSYTIAYKGGNAQSFVAKPADGTAPTVVSAQALTNQIVRVVFNKDVDVDTLVQGNIAIDNSLTVNSVALDTDYNADTVANSAGNVAVLVGTSAQAAGTLYTVTASNVKDVAGNAISSSAYTYKFAGASADTTAPTVQLAQANDDGTITVTFNETTQLDATSATNVANYTINGLTVKSATIASNKLNGTKSVTLAVNENMTAGNLYTVSVLNVADIYGNKITTASTANFAGVALRTSPVSLQTAVATTNTNVELTFNYNLDAASLVPANFTFDNSLTASAVAFGSTNNVVEVTTNAQTPGTLYTATVANVKDKLGNALNTSAYTAKFAGVAADTTGPSVSSANATAANTLVVTFNEKLDTASATNVLNYTVDNSLGYPTSATIDSTGKVVTLVVGNMTPGTLYKVTVSGVKDVAGNVVGSTNSATFPGVATVAAVKPSAVVALNNKQIKVVFNQPISSGTTIANFKVARTDAADTTTGPTAAATAAGSYVAFGGTTVANIQSDNTSVIITLDPTLSLASTGVYSIETTATGKYGAATDTAANTHVAFAGTSVGKPDIKIVSAIAKDLNHVDLTYSEALSSAVAAGTISFTQDDNTAVVFNATGVSLDANNNKVVHLTLNGNLNAAKVYRIDLDATAAANIKDASTLYAVKTDTTSGVYEGYLTTTGVAAVSKVNVISAVQVESNIIDVTFDQNIKTINGNAITNATDIALTAGDGTAIAGGAAVVKYQTSTSKPNVLRLYTNKDLTGSSNGVYKVAFGATDAAQVVYANDAGSTINLGVSGATTSYVFAKAVSDATPTFNSSVAVGTNVLKVSFSETVNPAGALDNNDFVVKAPTGEVLPAGTYVVSTSSSANTATAAGTYVKDLYIILQNGADQFVQGKTYTVELTTDGTGKAIVDLAGNKVKTTSVVDKTVSGISTAASTVPVDPTGVTSAAATTANAGANTKITITNSIAANTNNIGYIIEASTDGTNYSVVTTGKLADSANTVVDNVTVGAAATHVRVKLVNFTTGAVSAAPVDLTGLALTKN